MATCAFCRERGSSEEHVYAKWIAKLVAGTGPGAFRLTRRHGRNKTNKHHLGLTSRAACEFCNTRWMSDFEESAKPLLAPIIQDQPTRWHSIQDRIVVARWAFKTALMTDRSGKPKHYTAPDDDFEYLFAHRKPPPSVAILLGRYIPDAGEEFRVAWNGSSWSSATSPGGEEVKGYRITFSVGHAIFQTFGYLTPNRYAPVYPPFLLVSGKPLRDALRPLWPLLPAAHEWPPRGAHFATSGLDLLEPPGAE